MSKKSKTVQNKKTGLFLKICISLSCLIMLFMSVMAAEKAQFTPLDFTFVGDFSEGLAWVGIVDEIHPSKRSYGYIDKTGKLVIDLDYDMAGDFKDGLAAVKKFGKYGFINKYGEFVIGFEYDDLGEEYVYLFNEGLCAVSKNGKFGFIDTSGKKITDFKYDFSPGFTEGLAMVYKDDKFGFIDRTGKEVIEIKYDAALPFFEGLAPVVDEDWFSFIDKNERVIIPLYYDDANVFSEGMASVLFDNKWGFIDKKGKEIIPPQYDEILNFKEGLAAVRKGSKWGFIDKTGKVVIDIQFFNCGFFSEGLCVVYDDGKWVYIDKTGKKVFEEKFDYAHDFYEGVAVVLKDDKFGILQYPSSMLKTSLKISADSKKSDNVKELNDAKGQQNSKHSDLNQERNMEFDAKYNQLELTLNGRKVSGMESYNIAGNTYFKLRDIAMISNSTNKKFSVEWNQEKKLISIKTGVGYSPIGNELSGGVNGNKKAIKSNASLEIDGLEVELNAYLISGNTYFKLRDLGLYLGFDVDWDAENKRILLEIK